MILYMLWCNTSLLLLIKVVMIVFFHIRNLIPVYADPPFINFQECVPSPCFFRPPCLWILEYCNVWLLTIDPIKKLSIWSLFDIGSLRLYGQRYNILAKSSIQLEKNREEIQFQRKSKNWQCSRPSWLFSMCFMNFLPILPRICQT